MTCRCGCPNHCFACGVLLNRVEPAAAVGPLTISLYGGCWWNGKTVKLSPAQVVMVHALASSPGTYFRREALLNMVGSGSESSKTAEVLMHRARRAFLAVDPGFDRIVTWPHHGYAWRDETSVIPSEIRLETAPH